MLTAILAAVHLTTRTPEKAGEMLVDGKSVAVSELALRPVTGTVVTAKGTEKHIDAQGIALGELCPGDVRVTSSDEYSVTVHDGEDAYLIINDDGTVQLVVFGDENAKRCVKNVVRVDGI